MLSKDPKPYPSPVRSEYPTSATMDVNGPLVTQLPKEPYEIRGSQVLIMVNPTNPNHQPNSKPNVHQGETIDFAYLDCKNNCLTSIQWEQMQTKEKG